MVNETVPRTSLEDVPMYRAVLEGMGAGVVVLSIRGRIEYLNPACEKLLGLDLLEVRGGALRDYVASSDEMDRLAELRPHILSVGKWEGELRLTGRKGKLLTVRCHASLLRDSDGEPSAIVVVVEELDADNRTEAALMEALEQFRALAECMPSLVRFTWDDGRPAWYNPRFLEFSGLSYRELERGGWRALIHPDDVATIPAAGEREPWQAEIRMRRHDGQYRWMMVRTAKVFDARGAVIGFVGIAADIHERLMAQAAQARLQSAAEDALRELDGIYQSAPIGLAVMDREMRFVRVNERLARMNGVPVADHIGKRPADVVPEAAAQATAEIKQVLERGEPVMGLQLTSGSDGDPGGRRYYMENWIPLKNDAGDVVGMSIAVEDVTTQKRAQQAAEEALRELDAIFEATPVGLALFDSEMKWKKVNPEIVRMGRLPASEILGKAAGTAIPRTRAAFEEALALLNEGKPMIRKEREVVFPDGDVEYRLDSWVPVRNDAGDLLSLVVTAEDITVQKRAQQAAEEALRELDAVYQSAPIGLAVLDREMRFVRVNERLAEMTGAPVAAHIGKKPAEIIVVETDDGPEAVRAVMERGEPFFGLDVRAPVPGHPGEHRHFLQNWLPLKNGAGEVIGVSVAVEDVTERQHAETALRTSRERLQRVFDMLPEAVVISNARGEVTFADQQWVARTGLDPATASEEEMRELIHPDDRERIEERWRIAHSSGRPFTATYRTRHPDGSYRWQISRAVPLLGQDGKLREWIGTHADIDDVKQNQEMLATALAELDITYRTAPVGLGVLDLDLRYIRLNEQLAAVSGRPVEELIGQSVADVVPDIAEAVWAVRDKIVETGEAVIGVETEGFAPGPGEYRYCLENWIPIKDDDGNVIAISVSVEDVTSLKRAKQELDASHAELDAVFQATSVGLALLDRDLRYVRVNERLAELNGVEVKDHVGRTVREVLPGQGDYAEAMARRALAGERIVGDMRELEVDGVRRWSQVGWVPVRDEAGEIVGIGLAIEDVTPLKRAELRLQAALAELSTTYRFAPVGLAVFDPEGRFVRVNERLAEMHGLPAWEHIGRSSGDVLEGERDWAREIVRRAAATEEPMLGLEVTAAMPAGTGGVRHLRVSCAPMRNHRNEVFAVAAAVEDITDMKENESLLMASEHRLRAILDAVPAAVGVTDPEGRLAYLNRHWLEYSGMQLVGAKTNDLAATFHPEEIETVISGWTQAVEKAEPFEVLQRLRRADGDYRWHLGRTVPMRGPAGELTGWVSTNIDIHDRKSVEEQLETALAEIEGTYQGAPIGLAVVDRELRYVRVNEALAAANGMPAWRHVGRRLGALAHCSATDVEQVVEEVLATGEARLNVELASQPRRGRAQTWRLNMMPLRDAHRAIIGVSIAAEDVTTRKRADDEVRAAKDQLRRILDSISAPVIVLDEDGLLRFGNRHFWEYTGLQLNPDQVHPMEPLAEGILHPDEREGVLAGYRGALERIEGFATVCRLRRYDGEYRWHMGAAMAVPPGEDGKRQWVATYMDFQDRKQAEEALQAANRVKDEFLGMVSHELRTPLTTILGLSDMLHRRMDDMDRGTRAEALDQLQEDAKRLNELIENMLLLSRAEQAPFEPEPVMLQRVAPMVLAAAAERHREARWEMDLPEELPPVAGKAGWLEQVLQNLVTNSVKYSKGPAHVRVEARRAGADIELRVLDKGRGVKAEEAELMFEPFYRSARASSSQPGLGLGLAVCRRLVELMGGEISAAPRPGGGTIMTVRLRGAAARAD